MIAKLLLLGALAGAVTLPAAKAPATKAQEKVLYDFSEPAAEPVVTPEEEARVLPIVFKKFIKKGDKCPDETSESDDIERGRADFRAGRFSPEIVGMAKGSFVEKGRDEMAYLIAVHECALEGTRFETYRLTVIHDGKIVFLGDPLANLLFKVLDADGDGFDELLMGGQVIGQGSEQTSARLISLKNEKMKTLKDFDLVRILTCEWSGAVEEKGELATILVPGKKGKIQRRNYSRSCKESKAKGKFKLVSTDKPLL